MTFFKISKITVLFRIDRYSSKTNLILSIFKTCIYEEIIGCNPSHFYCVALLLFTAAPFCSNVLFLTLFDDVQIISLALAQLSIVVKKSLTRSKIIFIINSGSPRSLLQLRRHERMHACQACLFQLLKA